MLEIGLIFRALMRNKIGALLIALQIALTLAIMVNAIFMIQDRSEQMSRPSGLDEANTFYLTNTVFGEDYNLQAALQTDLHTLRNTPGIENAIQINAIPLSGGGWSMGFQHKPGLDQDSVGTAIYMVDEHGIDTLGVKLIAGQNFTKEDIVWRASGDTSWPPKVIITKGLAETLYPDDWQSAVGKTVYIASEQPMQVIGIIERLQAPWNGWSGVERSSLVPTQLDSKSARFFIRAEPGRRDEMMATVEKILSESDKQRIIRQVETLEETRAQSYRRHNATNKILTTVVITLTLITAFGIVGLAIFTINRRTKQIGTRRALGATQWQIMRYFMVENFLISTLGIVIGVLGAVGLNYWLVDTFSVDPIGMDLLLYGVIALLFVGQLAVCYPAHRASQISPATATRTA